MGSYSMLQIVGSTLVGGLFILMLFRFNATSNEKKHRLDTQNNIQSNMKEVMELLESDLNKIGYVNNYTISKETFEESILEATDSSFSFKTDVPISMSNPYGDGIVDVVKYYSDTFNTSTPNPMDKYFYRRENSDIPFELNYGLTNLKFTYYNSLGDSLLPPIDLKQITVVEYRITVEDIYGYNYEYNIDNADRKIDDNYYMTKNMMGKVAIKNLKYR